MSERRAEPEALRVLIRCDAGPEIGAGHFMRCLALAQALREAGGRAIFAVSDPEAWLRERLRLEGAELTALAPAPADEAEDAARTVEAARSRDAAWIVADGYRFGQVFQRKIKKAGFRLLLVDDNGENGEYHADLVLNQNLHADEQMYRRREVSTRLLLGPHYVLLRREFLRFKGRRREFPGTARKLLVTLGGADPDNVTLKVLRALETVNVEGLEATVLAGGSNPHRGELAAAAEKSRAAVRLLCEAREMPELMWEADAAVTAAGSTCWELAFTGLPAVLLVTADNQAATAAALAERGGVPVPGGRGQPVPTAAELAAAVEKLLRDAKERERQSRFGRELVDGGGAKRVVAAMFHTRLSLREAEEVDCRLLWEWANDPIVRSNAFNEEPIPWKDHVEWFSRKLQSTDCRIYVACEDNGKAVGQIRFDVGEKEAVVSISIASNRRGFGYGAEVIRAGIKRFFRDSPISIVIAFIKECNIASFKSFKKAGFLERGLVHKNGVRCWCLEQRRAQE